jgi:methylenetetrahydrofolate reductase (NADPH)
MLSAALVSAEVSLPARPDTLRVGERIAQLAETVDVVGLTDNHAGQARMSPLAAIALAREQGVATVAHVSCRDRNRLALQAQVIGAAALGSDGVLCMYGDPVEAVPRVQDLTATELIALVKGWAHPQDLAVGAVVNPFASNLDRELRLLERKIVAGAEFLQSQMVFDLDRLKAFLDRASDLIAGVRFFAGVALLRTRAMADRARQLPGGMLDDASYSRINTGGGIDLAVEVATELATLPGVDALHVFPLGAEAAVAAVASEFRLARGLTPTRR